MKSKFLTFILSFIFLFNIIATTSEAIEKKDYSKKVILVILNRTDLDDITKIENINFQMNRNGAIGLMNISGNKAMSELKSYANIGFGARSNVSIQDIDIQTKTKENEPIFKRRTSHVPFEANNLLINTLKLNNLNNDYTAVEGSLATTLIKNNKKISLIGNADDDLLMYRPSGLIAMDFWGRIQNAKIADTNIQDSSMPYGIRTNYNKVLKYTKQSYKENDLTIVELSDYYRLDNYEANLNEISYNKIHDKITGFTNGYFKKLFSILGENDRVYIVSPYPKNKDFSEKRRMTPVVVIDKNYTQGLLKSSTTRRDGIVANVDIPVDILNFFNIKDSNMNGRVFEFEKFNNPIQFLSKELNSIVANYVMRVPVLYNYAMFQILIWILILIALKLKDGKLNKNLDILFKLLMSALFFPTILLINPIIQTQNWIQTLIVICVLTIISVFIILKIKSEKIKIFFWLSFLTAILILIDTILGQNMIKRSLFGYDAMIGARYYGVGNEYMGTIIGSTLIYVSCLLQNNKIKKWFASFILLITMIIIGFPKFGANVGGTITATACFLIYILQIYNLKLDAKKILGVFLGVVIVVSFMAFIDICILKSHSHLAGAITQISKDGPIAILQIINRKIAMNIKLIGVTVWSKVLIIGILIMGLLFKKPFGVLAKIFSDNEFLSKGWTAILIGSFVGFCVNDSGIVCAATSIIFVLSTVIGLVIDELK